MAIRQRVFTLAFLLLAVSVSAVLCISGTGAAGSGDARAEDGEKRSKKRDAKLYDSGYMEDNESCLICHMDFKKEKIAVEHLEHGITCAGCHGDSDAHRGDEWNVVRPDVLWGRAEITADSKEKPEGSMFESLRKNDIGMIGIKPFASGSVFKSRGQPDSATKEEDDQRARIVLRYVLACDVLTAAIPGLVTIDQVKNAAKAVQQRRELDVAETEKLKQISEEMWANLPKSYEWLRDWEWV